MARTNGPIQVWHRTDTIPTDAEGGYAGGDSTAAAVGGAQAAATQAVATVDNLSATATALPPGASPTVTVSGPVPNKVINIGVPRGADGAPGMGYAEGQQLLSQNASTLAAAQAAQSAAASSASDADDAVTLAQQAQAAALEVPDANVSALLANPATDTRAAIDAAYRPAARSPITGWWHADRFGDGEVTRESLQAAIDAAAEGVTQNGQGGTVYVPDPPPGETWTIAGTVTLRPRVRLLGNGRTKALVRTGEDLSAGTDEVASSYALTGDGSGPVLRAGSYNPSATPKGRSNDAMDVRVEGLSVKNADAPVLELLTATNFTVRDCELRSMYETSSPTNQAVKLRYAWRGVIENCKIGCRNGTAIEAFDNINGVRIIGNVLSGGAAADGCAVKVGQSIAVMIASNVIERSRHGIIISPAQDDSGASHNVTLDTNYHEENYLAVVAGEGFEVRGLRITNAYMGGTQSLPRQNTDTPGGIRLVRVRGWTIEQATFFPWESEPLLIAARSTGNPDTVQPVQGRVGGCYVHPKSGETAALVDMSAIANVSDQARFWGLNRIDLDATGASPESTGSREWISPVLTANVTFPSTSITGSSTRGGIIESIELVDVTGSLAGCLLQVGSTTVPSELVNIADLSTIATTNRHASLPVAFARAWRGGTSMLVRTSAGSGTGTFRVRVRWSG